MNAYQDLMTALVGRRPDQSAGEDDRIVREALAMHAHELAEQQWAFAEEEWTGSDARMILRRRIARHLADLIDPSAGPVRPDEEPSLNVTLDNTNATYTPHVPLKPHYPDEEPTT